ANERVIIMLRNTADLPYAFDFDAFASSCITYFFAYIGLWGPHAVRGKEAAIPGLLLSDGGGHRDRPPPAQAFTRLGSADNRHRPPTRAERMPIGMPLCR